MFNFRKDTIEEYKKQEKVNLENYYENHNIWREIEDYWYYSHPKIIEKKKI